MTWDPIRKAQDKLTLALHPSPGICEITGAASKRKWDELTGYAVSGGLLIYRGIALSHFTCTFFLYTLEHWVEWEAFRPVLIRPPLGKRPAGLDIVHPVLAELGIHQCVIEEVGGAVQSDNGVWSIAIQCIEFRQPRGNTIAKVDAAEATPSDPTDDFIADLRNQVNAVAADPGD